MAETNINNILNPLNSLKLFGLKGYFFDFTRLFKLNRFPKVILLTGEKGIGKFTLSLHIINYILSSNSNHSYDYDNQIINQKNSFYKSIVNNICENFIYIPNEYHEKTKIENIRSIKNKFNTTALNDMPRFTILDDVELLNVNAANSILKLIEEPSDNNYFILINNKRKKIIETIRSRTLETKIFLNSKKKDQVLEELIKYHNLEDHFSYKFRKFTSPGRLVKYSESIKNLKIDANTNLYDATQILLENFKKTKNDIFLDFANFFLEIKFSQKINFDYNQSIKMINNKNYLIKLLYNYKNFNLSNTSVLDYIKRQEGHA